MKTKTVNRTQKRIPTRADDESRAAAAEIAAAAREVALASKARPEELDAALEDPDTIPMLTDVLGDDAADNDTAAPSPEKTEAKETEEPADHESTAAWNQVAMRVEQNVMERITRRTDEFIEGELRDQLDDILDAGCERLLADVRHTMQQSVRAALARAIAEEMGKSQHAIAKSSKKQEKDA